VDEIAALWNLDRASFPLEVLKDVITLMEVAGCGEMDFFGGEAATPWSACHTHQVWMKAK
jgi:hypothetical protein